jgi:hypothetical protein
MDPINFNLIKQGETLHGNYRLRGQAMGLVVKVTPVFDAPGTAEWENEGGACAPPPYEEVINWRNKTEVRTKGGKHQRAAKAFIPRESITIVPIKVPVDHFEAIAAIEGKTPDDIKVEELKQEIERQAELLRRMVKQQDKEEESVRRLQEKFEIRRIR